MPYTNKPRPYKKEWAQEQARNEKPERAGRARARRKLDAEGVDRGEGSGFVLPRHFEPDDVFFKFGLHSRDFI